LVESKRKERIIASGRRQSTVNPLEGWGAGAAGIRSCAWRACEGQGWLGDTGCNVEDEASREGKAEGYCKGDGEGAFECKGKVRAS
jgi:hypothetical protein